MLSCLGVVLSSLLFSCTYCAVPSSNHCNNSNSRPHCSHPSVTDHSRRLYRARLARDLRQLRVPVPPRKKQRIDATGIAGAAAGGMAFTPPSEEIVPLSREEAAEVFDAAVEAAARLRCAGEYVSAQLGLPTMGLLLLLLQRALVGIQSNKNRGGEKEENVEEDDNTVLLSSVAEKVLFALCNAGAAHNAAFRRVETGGEANKAMPGNSNTTAAAAAAGQASAPLPLRSQHYLLREWCGALLATDAFHGLCEEEGAKAVFFSAIRGEIDRIL